MRKSELVVLLEYLYRQEQELETELNNCITNLRFRRVDTVDCYDLAALIDRYTFFKEVYNNILTLLNICFKE